ncbi:hypothetical protein pb186bvf_011320 [Paramecium bursaria]
MWCMQILYLVSLYQKDEHPITTFSLQITHNYQLSQ